MIDIRHGSPDMILGLCIPCKNDFLLQDMPIHASVSGDLHFFQSYIPARPSQYSDVRTFAQA